MRNSHHTVVREKTDDGYTQFDVYSRLLEDRIIYIDTDFNDQMASLVSAQLMILSRKSEKEDITIYINSPGGSVSSGMCIYDTMQLIPNVVKTIVMGTACSMGAFLLSAGTKGHRYATPSSTIMIHMVSSGTQGTTVDNNIRMAEVNRLNDYLDSRLAIHCGKKLADIKKATNRDNWMTPKKAKAFGLIDEIYVPENKLAWKTTLV